MIFFLYNKYRKRQDLKRLCQINIVIKNNALLGGGRYFFMEITKSNKIIIKDIMYSLSIAITSFERDDSITARLYACIGLALIHYTTYFILFQHLFHFDTYIVAKILVAIN